MNKRSVRMPFAVLCAAMFCFMHGGLLPNADAASRPNILLIGIDDLNDWIGCLGGHPQAQTPNIDRLAARGVLFANAHCQSPVCNPSRASMMTSLYPETTGIYFLNPNIAKSPVAKNSEVLPARLEREGYHIAGAGKLFHSRENKQYITHYAGSFGGFGPLPKKKLTAFKGVKLWDWGVFPEKDEDMPDYKIASWSIEQLRKTHDKPLFLVAGMYRPHVPQYASQKWFDLYPLETLKLPETIANDLDDVPAYGNTLTRKVSVAPSQKWVVQNDEWKPLVQSYLACVSFVDHQVGRLLDAFDKSVYKNNTYIVLFSDHGFHLGEKERWAKRSLWEPSTKVPLIIVGPGIAGSRVCRKPVELIDIYPTLLALAGLEADPKHEGQSLVPLLNNIDADWPHLARTSMGPGNLTLRSERYRYIRYKDGSEEFYDLIKDPNEWTNLAGNPEMEQLMARHRALLPTDFHSILGGGTTGHKSYQAAEKERR